MEELENDVAMLASQIWLHPELGLEENFAAALYEDYFQKQGFCISKPSELPTGLIAEFGSGSPILGVLGEYDALPGLWQSVSSQENGAEGKPGHGCGHNLLGAASAVACVAIKRYLEENEIQGTIRFYGCPAEELGKGKIEMDEQGLFNDLDACYTWHPGSWNAVTGSKLSALIKAEFFFTGRSAHAGAHPELGRSALDGVELMNVGANYLREHIPQGAKLHYVITNGGLAANIVPAEASVQYMVRAPRGAIAHEVYERLMKVANGAAMMTETSVQVVKEKDNYDTLNNQVLEDLTDEVYQECGGITFSQEECELAKALVETLPEDHYTNARSIYKSPDGIYLDGEARDILGRGETFGASSDVGQVSYRVPTVQCSATCFPLGVPLHAWQTTASAGSDFGNRGATYMAKIITRSLERLLEDDTGILEKARQEFMAEK
jgi:aminobenzoyl-glutamate utilization protein B